MRIESGPGEHTRTLVLSGVPDGNRLNTGAWWELSQAIEALQADAEVWVIALRADGSDFCRGLDPGDAELQLLYADLHPDAAGLRLNASPFQRLIAMDKPLVAVLSGAVLDAGLELALACDLRLALPGTTLGLTEIRTGRLPANGGSQLLTRVVGPARAAELMLTGRIIDREEAARIGLVTPVPDATAAEAFVQELGEHAPIAMRYTKEAARRGSEMRLEDGLQFEADLNFLLLTTEDRDIGLAAFLGKQRARYRGV